MNATIYKNLVIFSILLTYSLSHCSIACEDKNECDGYCVNWTSAVAAANNNSEQHKPSCTQISTTLIVYCFGAIIDNDEWDSIEELVICGWPNKEFDPIVQLKTFPNIKSLRIEHSPNMSHFHNDFPPLMELQGINVSWTGLHYWRRTLYEKLTNLVYSDLRWNKLEHMESPLVKSDKYKVYLAGNPWNCTKDTHWLLNETVAYHVADRRKMICGDKEYNDRPVLIVEMYKTDLKRICKETPDLRNCTCKVFYILSLGPEKILKPKFSIDCSGKKLDHLPSFIPKNTTTFKANDNKITSIEPLRSVYRDVEDIYLDYNFIENIDILEDDYWLNHFRIFSLKGNKISKVPVYAIRNALEKNKNVAKLHLSQNPWSCDCTFMLRFQELLMRFHQIMDDSANITCKYIEGDENYGLPVLTLKRGDFCKLNKESKIYSLNLLNGVLAALIILVLGKLAYDYYHYRKSGRLPWIVTKLP